MPVPDETAAPFAARFGEWPGNFPPTSPWQTVPVDHDPFALDRVTSLPEIRPSNRFEQAQAAFPSFAAPKRFSWADTWPARLVADVIGGAQSFGRAAAGEQVYVPGLRREDVTDNPLAAEPNDAAIRDMNAVASLAMLGATGAPAGALGSGPVRRSLPMDEASRMARAAEQGYTIDAYHGTGAPEFPAFDSSKVRDNIQYGGNFYFSPSAEFANRFTGKWSGDDARVMPVKLKSEKPFRMDQPIAREDGAKIFEALGRPDLAKKAREEWKPYDRGSTLFYWGMGQDTPVAKKAEAIRKAGFDAIMGDPQLEIAGTPGRPHIMVYEPSQIRSRFAAFDPAKIGTGDLLASGAAIMGAGYSLVPIDHDPFATVQ